MLPKRHKPIGLCNEDVVCFCEVRNEFSSASYIDFVFKIKSKSETSEMFLILYLIVNNRTLMFKTLSGCNDRKCSRIKIRALVKSEIVHTNRKLMTRRTTARMK